MTDVRCVEFVVKISCMGKQCGMWFFFPRLMHCLLHFLFFAQLFFFHIFLIVSGILLGAKIRLGGKGGIPFPPFPL